LYLDLFEAAWAKTSVQHRVEHINLTTKAQTLDQDSSRRCAFEAEAHAQGNARFVQERAATSLAFHGIIAA